MEIKSEWVLQIDNELMSNEPSVILMEMENKWKKQCIYEIPSHIANLNKSAYRPQTVSFGPYHYGEEHLMGMEEHKHRALLYFFKRCGKPLKMLFQSMMGEVEQDLRDSYKPLRWKEGNSDDDNEFLRMMILDGCFMLEILRYGVGGGDGDYAVNDPVFSEYGRVYVIPYIKRDMLVLENQLPMIVLHKLIEFEGRKTQEEEEEEELLNELILKFLSPVLEGRFGKCCHILDLYRKSLLGHDPRPPHQFLTKQKPSSSNNTMMMPPARMLEAAGIKFNCRKIQSLTQVSFHERRNILSLPLIIIDDSTEILLLNLIAFERLHVVGAGNEVSSYLFFLDSIIDNELDVTVLEKNGILYNALGSNNAVAKLVNSMKKDVTLDWEERGLNQLVMESVCRFYKKPWNHWRANLIETYNLRDPWNKWRLAAIIIFLLTVIQTAYTIRQSYNSNSSSAPQPPHGH